MKILGLIAVKQNSNRFPGKNLHEIDGAPMFWHNVQALLDSDYIDDVYVATDSDFIKKYCLDRDVPIVCRGPNTSIDEQPIFDILKFAYFAIHNDYDMVVTILPNTVGHNTGDVNRCVKLMQSTGCREVRSFDKDGRETGIIGLHREVLLWQYNISAYLGCIITSGREIHYEHEF